MALEFHPADKGILPDRMIDALARAGAIVPARPLVPGQIQPASLDLRLDDVAFRVRASFLPGPGTSVADRIAALKLHQINLGRRCGVGDRLCLHRAADGAACASG